MAAVNNVASSVAVVYPRGTYLCRLLGDLHARHGSAAAYGNMPGTPPS
jgi:hypothetical protein